LSPVTMEAKSINLALQGGGAHGAFTWGVLDRLVEDSRLKFEGISATSTGAMNGAVFAYGYTTGGRKGAQQALEQFWLRVSRAASPHVFRTNNGEPSAAESLWSDYWRTYWRLFSPLFAALARVTYLVSPYEFNPLNINPLKSVLEESVDFAVLRRRDCAVKLYLAATNVRNGKIRIFENGEMNTERVLASACLPTIFQAVEVDGEHYWNGGYIGNPALFPLIYNCTSRDIVVVHINPLERRDLPRSAFEILNRINEISFNSALMREMRVIGFITKLIDDGVASGQALPRVLMHAIWADEVTTKLGMASMFQAHWDFLRWLRDTGRRYADQWLAANFYRLGKESTVDVQERYA
jgi:NTE family protein